MAIDLLHNDQDTTTPETTHRRDGMPLLRRAGHGLGRRLLALGLLFVVVNRHGTTVPLDFWVTYLY